VVARADVLFVCVKPGGVKALLQEVAPALGSRHLVVSIAAGVTLADLQAAAGPEARVCLLYTSDAADDYS
jgi:pyrroline-5-carboxylate reductase